MRKENRPDYSQAVEGYFLTRAGKTYHELVQKDLRDAFGSDWQMEERSVATTIQWGDYRFVVHGRLDGYYGPTWSVVELKSIADEAYQDITTLGIPGRSYFENYIFQGCLYAEALELQHQIKAEDIWIIPINRCTGAVSIEGCHQPVQRDSAGLLLGMDSVWERWGQVEKALREAKAPGRPYTRQGFECRKFCNYKSLCWAKGA